jgi:uncharacterized SAM-binding protein YcdF (DUF218 family)
VIDDVPGDRAVGVLAESRSGGAGSANSAAEGSAGRSPSAWLRRRKARTRSARWHRLRWFRRAFVTVLALFLAWVIAGLFVFVHPTTDAPRHVDAILVLGPPSADGRIDLAYSLFKQGYASNLVISGPTPNTPEIKAMCTNDAVPATGAGSAGTAAGTAGASQIICFQPNPRTTRGESMKIHQLARRYHWHSIMVVTSTYHISRARTIMKRCNPETIVMVAAHQNISFGEWAYQYVRQTAGYVKLLTHTAC